MVAGVEQEEREREETLAGAEDIQTGSLGGDAAGL